MRAAEYRAADREHVLPPRAQELTRTDAPVISSVSPLVGVVHLRRTTGKPLSDRLLLSGFAAPAVSALARHSLLRARAADFYSALRHFPLMIE